MRIKLPNTKALRAAVPGYVWRTPPFRFVPQSFAVESEALKERVIDEDYQVQSLDRWMSDPQAPVLYGVSGSPDDSRAKYFAAYLVHVHQRALGGLSAVHWTTLYGGFDKPRVMESSSKPSLIVITNLTQESTAHRIEKARDLIEAFPDTPRIVVSCGTDPISFFATRLRQPLHSLAYFLDSQVRTRVSVL